MKHLPFLAFLFLVPFALTAQSLEPIAPGEAIELEEGEIIYALSNKTCRQGRKRANRDIARGKLIYLTYGLPVKYDFTYVAYENQFILENYGVETGLGGCVITPYSDCYQKAMDQAIEKKYGKDFLFRAMKEAQAAYPTSAYFRDKVVPVIEKGEIFDADYCEEGGSPVMGEEAFKKLIQEIVLPEKDSLGNYFSIMVVIDREGNPIDWDIRADISLERRWEIRDALPDLKWVPAKYYGTPANCRLEYDIYFE